MDAYRRNLITKAKNIHELDTPTLLLDIDKMEGNLNDIASFAKQQVLNWRPHIKTHKSMEIAKRQIEKGACGITVAKINEAEVMTQAGITDILIAYPISSPTKLHRLLELNQFAQIKVAVDSLEQVTILNDFFQQSSKPLEVWIKVNSGLNRCGVEPGLEAVTLAKDISSLSNLQLNGILTHAGHSYAASSIEQIESIARYEGESVVESALLCEKEGIPIPIKSVGSTPTFKIAGKVSGITEIRPGNAVFYDAIQVGLGVTKLENCALSLLASVVSTHGNSRLILDTGSKSLCLDQGAHGNKSVKGFGQVLGHPEITIERLSEEHGVATVEGETRLRIQDKVRIIPNHACTVVNLFDRVVVHRNETIIDEWLIDARGRSQ